MTEQLIHTHTHTHTHTSIPSAGLFEELAAGWASVPSAELNFLLSVPELQNAACRSSQASYGLVFLLASSFTYMSQVKKSLKASSDQEKGE